MIEKKNNEKGRHNISYLIIMETSICHPRCLET